MMCDTEIKSRIEFTINTHPLPAKQNFFIPRAQVLLSYNLVIKDDGFVKINREQFFIKQGTVINVGKTDAGFFRVSIPVERSSRMLSFEMSQADLYETFHPITRSE